MHFGAQRRIGDSTRFLIFPLTGLMIKSFFRKDTSGDSKVDVRTSESLSKRKSIGTGTPRLSSQPSQRLNESASTSPRSPRTSTSSKAANTRISIKAASTEDFGSQDGDNVHKESAVIVVKHLPNVVTVSGGDHLRQTVFRTTKEADILAASRQTVFRTHAEEKELHFRKITLIEQSTEIAEEVIFEEYVVSVINELAPVLAKALRSAEEEKINKLGERLGMALVADPDELLQHRDQSFLEERGGAGYAAEPEGDSHKENKAAKHTAVCSAAQLPARQCSGEEGMHRALMKDGERPNPLLMSRGRRSVTMNRAGPSASTTTSTEL